MYFTNPNDYSGTDYERIQSAIDDASAKGLNMTVITRKEENPSAPWEVDHAIELPSDFTLVVENCTLMQAEGAFCNLIINKNCYLPIGRTWEGRQHNIRILGHGNAVLSGGVYNDLCEKNANRDGRPPIWVNNLILIANAEHVTVSGFRMEKQRWYAMDFLHVAHARVSDIEFAADCSLRLADGTIVPGIPADSEYRDIYIKNADGIDLRVGCHDFVIENLSGFCEDDVVALNALTKGGKLVYDLEGAFSLEGDEPSIHDIIIRDIHACGICSILRLLNQGGTSIYNVLVDGVVDTWTPSSPSHRTYITARIGDGYPYGGRMQLPEETRNITFRNFICSAEWVGIEMTGGMSHVLLENIRAGNMREGAPLMKLDAAEGPDIVVR